MARLMVVNNPKKRKLKKKKITVRKKKRTTKKRPTIKTKKKVSRKKRVVKRKKLISREKREMAKKKRPRKKRKSVTKRRTPIARAKTTRTRRRRRLGGRDIIKTAIMPAAIGGAGAVALDVVLAMLPLPAPMKSGPGKLLIRGGAAIAGGMAISKVVDKKIGNAFMLGGLTLLAADITKNLVSNAFPNLALSAYSHEFDDDMGEYMSEYMSESGEDDLGFISTGPIVGSMEYGETYDQDGLGVNDWDMDDAHAELIEIDEY
jgi:hypothetical protein